MTPSSAVDVVRESWRLMASNDSTAVGAVLADDLVLDWPQSNERIRDRANFAAMNAEHPASRVVSDVSVTDGVQQARALSFFTIQDGRIARVVECWSEPHLVERIA